MYRNYLKITIRNLFRAKAFSLINISGLALSMSVCLLIIMILKDQYSFDKFHVKKDRTYRVNTNSIRKNNSEEKYASTAGPVAGVLKEFTQIEDVVHLTRGLSGEIAANQSTFDFSGFYTGNSFFSVFSFPLEGMDRDRVLNEPYTIILTKELAAKLFGEQDPIGQIVVINDGEEYSVTGIIDKKKLKTHLEFEALASISTVPSRIRQEQMRDVLGDWSNIYSSYVYFTLNPGRDAEEIESTLAGLTPSFYENVEIESRSKAFEFFMQPLTTITPGPHYSNNLGGGMSMTVLQFLAGFSLLILLAACFNFTNLSIAKSLNRAREIGVRKVQGARRSQVFGQFITESVLYALMAFVLAYFLLQFIMPGFKHMELNSELDVTFAEDLSLYGLFALFAVFCGFIAGVLPSIYVSAFNPLSVIRNASLLSLSRGPWYTRMGLRKGLMVLQFGLCLLFIFMALVISSQSRYVLAKDSGLDSENILNIRLRNVDFDHFSNAAAGLSAVQNVSGISISLGTWADQSDDYRVGEEDERRLVRNFFIDRNYIENLRIEMMAGTNFPEEASAEREQFAIVNERALTEFGWESPSDALGESLIIGDSTYVQVIGVMKDFHFRPMTYEIGPVVFRYNPAGLNIVNVRLAGENQEETISNLENIWSKFDSEHPMEWQFMDAEIQESYTFMKDMTTILGFFSVLAISIASLGLLGMVIFSMQNRVREVGIRKIMGAGEWKLVFHLSRQFAILLAISVVVFLPAALFLGDQFLSTFAYRIGMGLETWGITLLIIIILGGLTIGSQTLRTAMSNPVDTLRRE